jgi:4'-phosphopantetheinyl transferase
VDTVHRLAQVLADDERARAERFRFERDRTRFVVGRGTLRTILSRYLCSVPEGTHFCYGEYGKPALAQGDIRFNLAHSQDLALYAIVRGQEIGVDLECIHPIAEIDQIVGRYFSARERAVFRVFPARQIPETFLRFWVCKEAYLKAVGCGLSGPLDMVEVSLAWGERPRFLNIAADPVKAGRWHLHPLEPAPGYVAAVAIEGHSWQFRYWDFSISATVMANLGLKGERYVSSRFC